MIVSDRSPLISSLFPAFGQRERHATLVAPGRVGGANKHNTDAAGVIHELAAVSVVLALVTFRCWPPFAWMGL